MNKHLKISILTFFILIIALFGFWKYLEYSDNPLIQARQLRPLDGTQEYRIVAVNYGEDVEPFVYGIIKPDEPEDSGSLSWRLIGESPVDLTEYLNKPVLIKGGYYLGTPLAAKGVNVDDPQIKQYFQEQVVIRIEEITSL